MASDAGGGRGGLTTTLFVRFQVSIFINGKLRCFLPMLPTALKCQEPKTLVWSLQVKPPLPWLHVSNGKEGVALTSHTQAVQHIHIASQQRLIGT